MYVPYVVPYYPHIPYLGYLHTSSSRIISSMFTPNYSKSMSEHRRKKRNIISNEKKKKIIDAMSRREGYNQYLVSVSVDLSQKDQDQNK